MPTLCSGEHPWSTSYRAGADIMIMKQKNFKKPDKTPYAYNQQSFSLDGMMSMDMTFNVTLTTPVYIKLDSKDQLLLSEGQLGIVQYHPRGEVNVVMVILP